MFNWSIFQELFHVTSGPKKWTLELGTAAAGLPTAQIPFMLSDQQHQSTESNLMYLLHFRQKVTEQLPLVVWICRTETPSLSCNEWDTCGSTTVGGRLAKFANDAAEYDSGSPATECDQLLKLDSTTYWVLYRQYTQCYRHRLSTIQAPHSCSH